MSTVIWSKPASERQLGRDQSGAKSPVSVDHDDLTWLSFSETCEPHAVDSDICHRILVCESDPNMASPGPFLSNEDWRKLVARHPR